MSQILTFLGKGGTGRSTLAVAAARAAAQQGRRVLLVGHQAGPGLEMLLGGIPLSGEPVTIAANLSVVQLRTTQLLEQFWTAAKELEARYVRTPFSGRSTARNWGCCRAWIRPWPWKLCAVTMPAANTTAFSTMGQGI